MGSSTLFRIRLDCIETQCQENAFVSTNFMLSPFTFLHSLKRMQVTLLFVIILQSPGVSDLRSLWIPSPTVGPVATAHLVRFGIRTRLTSLHAKSPCEGPSCGSQSAEVWATRLSSPASLYGNPPQLWEHTY